MPLLDNVRYFDIRILTLDTAEPERFLTSEKKNVLVDLFVKWRITDVRQYYYQRGRRRERRRRPAAADHQRRACARSSATAPCTSGVRRARQDHGAHARRRRTRTRARSASQVLDVRLKRVDLPQEVSESVYRRMEAERKRVANELRSTGAAESEKIRADADRQREVIIAEAYRDAQRIKGEGDAKAVGDLRARLRAESRVLRVLPQPRGVQAELQEQERRAGARAELRVLQVPQDRAARPGK